MPRFANRARLTPPQAGEVMRELSDLDTLDDVEAWLEQRDENILSHVVHGQDAHELVARWRYGKIVCFALSCDARVKEVSVWDFQPTDEDLLEARRQAGALEEVHEHCAVAERLT